MSSDEFLQSDLPNQPASPNHSAPTAISFREYRDEEIVDFFANGQRTFTPVDGDFGRKRIVGAAHSPAERKPTAAFRSALAAKHGTESKPKEKSVLCGSVPKSAPHLKAVPVLPQEPKVDQPRLGPRFGKQSKPLGSVIRKSLPQGRAGRILADPVQETVNKLRESQHVGAPCTANPGIALDDGLQNLAERASQPLDAELALLVARWPRLSPSLKEIIGTLIGSETPAAG